jgi:uncharacterized delta-60 repeat protein
MATEKANPMKKISAKLFASIPLIITVSVAGTPLAAHAATEVPANFDWSFLPAVVPSDSNLAIVRPDGTIVTVDLLYDRSTPPDPQNATARILFLSQDADATGTASIRLQNDFSTKQVDVHGLMLQPDGKLLLTGTFTRVNGQSHNSLVRLNRDGSLDSAFQADFGPVEVNTSFFFELSVLAVFPDGRIVVNVVDHAANMVSVLVVGADGKFDTSFAPTRVSEEICCSPVLGATTQDGKALIFGPEIPGLLRLGFNGGVDDTFKPDFQMPADPNFGTNTIASIQAVLSAADGRLIVAGDFTSVNGTSRSYIARLNADGTLDPSFKAQLSGPFHGTATILSDRSILVLSDKEFVEFDSDGQVKSRFTVPRPIKNCDSPAIFGGFALQSEVPKRILLLFMNSCFSGVNGVVLPFARVLLEGPASAFQIVGEMPSGPHWYAGNAFAIDEAEHGFEFVVQRLGETTGAATVKFTTADGTARAGVDYIAQAGTLNFAPFETEKYVTVPLTGLQNRESRVFFVSLSDATDAKLFGQPPVPVTIMGKALASGKIAALRMPQGGVALIFGELISPIEFETHSLVEVSLDLKTWLPSAGYRFKPDDNAVVWIDPRPRLDTTRFYRVREDRP